MRPIKSKIKFGPVTQKDIDSYHRKPRALKCKLGHHFTMKNSKYQFDTNGSVRRRCRQCENIRHREYYKSYHKEFEVHWTEMLMGGV